MKRGYECTIKTDISGDELLVKLGIEG